MVAVALRTITARLANRQFTTAEAAAMLGLTVTEVNNLIDEIAPLGVVSAGRGRRSVSYRGLFTMLVAKELVYCQLNPEMRPQTLVQALAAKGKRVVVPGTNLEVLVDSYRKQVNQGLRALYEAESAIESRRDVMQGEPCMKGTRIPAYIVASIASSRGVDEAIRTYPSMDKRKVELAQIFAKAHPRKGRPKKTIIPASGRVTSQKVIKRKKPKTGA
jgi:uncharacterized protein (DUF433 family)